MNFRSSKRFLQFYRQFFNYNNCTFYSKNVNKYFVKRIHHGYNDVFENYKKFVNGDTILCSARWKDLRSEIKTSNSYLREINIDRILLKCVKSHANSTASDKLQNGLNFVDALKEVNKIPSILICTDLIDLYCQKANSDGLSQEEVTDLLKICDQIAKTPFEALPGEIFISFLKGLCLTPQWRRCFDLIKQAQALSIAEQKAYSVIIKKALRENESQVAWKYLPLAVLWETRKRLDPSIFLEYWNYCRRLTDKPSIRRSIDGILRFIAENQIEMPEDAARELNCLIKETKIGTSEYFSFNSLDKCYVCDNHFPCVSITQKEHKILTNAIKNNVVIGKSIFSKTTPKEFRDFIDLVDRTGPYDFVLDGLNIALMSSRKNAVPPFHDRAQQLAAVVKHLVQQRKRILVIGRKHMNAWPGQHMNYIKENTNFFFLDNISADDPFLLYAALLSGPQTHILSRDFMRTHASLLKGNQKTIFKRWQQQHQYFLEPFDYNGQINVYQAIKYEMLTHKVNDRWHIPFISQAEYDETLEEVFEMPMNWICCKIDDNTD